MSSAAARLLSRAARSSESMRALTISRAFSADASVVNERVSTPGGESSSRAAQPPETRRSGREESAVGAGAIARDSGETSASDQAATKATTTGRKLGDKFPKDVVDDIYRGSFRSQTGVSLKYMLDFGAQPIHKQLMVSAQFLHNELPVRLAHRVAELENLPFGLSDMP